MEENLAKVEQPSSVTAAGVAGGLEIFRAILKAYGGAAGGFTNFHSGVLDREEGYKARNHEIARERLALTDWYGLSPGSGKILARLVDAIEIREDKAKGIIQNNVLTWWPPNLAHRRVLDIRGEGGARLAELERHLRDLYLDRRPEAEIFGDLSQKEMLGRNYPLLGYIFFLKDIDRFVPVTPSGLQRGLVEIGADLSLIGRASWDNYNAFLLRLGEIAKELERQTGLDVRLIDAHSFIWVIGSWERPDAAGRILHRGGAILTACRVKAHRRMVITIQNTVKNANGQQELRRIKDKITDMTDAELEAHIDELMAEGRICKLTGCEMLYDGEPRSAFEKHFLVSADRIDSDIGYVRGNIQLVCQFANFFKGHRYSDAVFKELLESVRSGCREALDDES
ncbi:MAG: hypothetical protein ACE369_08020 [Roseovarius sp.]